MTERLQGAHKRPPAVLVGVQLDDADDDEFRASMAELGRLVATLGYEPVAEVCQRRDHLAPSAVLGEGKLEELGKITGGKGRVPSAAKAKTTKARERFEPRDGGREEPDEPESDDEDEASDTLPDGRVRPKLVAVDHELSPSQARNLEKACGVTVLDRTGVIVEIFHRHARSREAKLQVELARLKYVAPRLREGSGGDRQRGGIGGKGAGESALELDRRRIRDRVAEIEQEIAALERDQDNRRARRRDAMRVALVGYTNAGKSSLMRALTGSEVYVEDKLFATLDTTVRALQPETRPRILVSDTVGFIKKLPHDLVASFRSTLDEAHEASLLLFVADASDPTFRSQLAVTKQVLSEIGALETPSQLVLNKCDRLTEEARAELGVEFPDALQLSAHDPADVSRLRQWLVDYFDRELVELRLDAPHRIAGALVAEAHARGRVVDEQWDDEGAKIVVRATAEDAARLRALAER
ncbi:MAG: GTPase HflX [Myxococcales bacterium]|nr:GTPase HflX [Myxococcales bacterium]